MCENIGSFLRTQIMTNLHIIISSLLSSRIFIANGGCRLTFPSWIVLNLESVDRQGVVPIGASSAIKRVVAAILRLPESNGGVTGYYMKPSNDSFLEITVNDVSSLLIFVAVSDRSVPKAVGEALQRPRKRLIRYQRVSGSLSQRGRRVGNHGNSFMNPAMAEDEGQECKKHEAVECNVSHGEGRVIRVGSEGRVVS